MQTSHRFSILGCVLNPEAVERGVSKQVIWTSFTFVDERNLETKIYTIFKISSKKCWSRNFERSIFIIQDCRLSFQILRVLEYVYVFSCSLNLCFSQFVFSPNCTYFSCCKPISQSIHLMLNERFSGAQKRSRHLNHPATLYFSFEFRSSS